MAKNLNRLCLERVQDSASYGRAVGSVKRKPKTNLPQAPQVTGLRANVESITHTPPAPTSATVSSSVGT